MYGGKGNDTLTAIRGTIKAGPGDDRVVSSVSKHLESTDVDLGSGDDTVVLQSALKCPSTPAPGRTPSGGPTRRTGSRAAASRT